MRFCGVSAIALALTSVASSAALMPRDDLLADLQNKAMEALKEAEVNGTLEKRSCSLSTAYARRDWDYMSKDERKSYIKAVKCLISSPSKTPAGLVPGAKSRYDDFVAQHINQTLSIHGTGNFLTWHRYFVYGYEKALRDECGYKGYQPYWNWFSYQNDLSKSPVFDGSETSMGGDGAFFQHDGSISGAGNIPLPSGNGGGCIKSGPFKDLQLNLGPVFPAMAGYAPVANPFDYNPRCARRDFLPTTNDFTLTNLYNLTLGAASKSVFTFQNELQGRFTDGFLGTHTTGHVKVGGDAADFFSSTNDPVFFMHHAMLDRVWWIWQALHLNQAKTVAGTITILNNPPSRDTTLQDVISTNFLNMPDRPIGDLLGSLDGEPFCYIYL